MDDRIEHVEGQLPLFEVYVERDDFVLCGGEIRSQSDVTMQTLLQHYVNLTGTPPQFWRVGRWYTTE